MPINLDDGNFTSFFVKGTTSEGKVGTSRLVDVGDTSDIMPQAVVLVDSTGVPYKGATGTSSTGSILAQQNYDATASGMGYATGDILNRTLAENTTTNAITTYWFNLTQGTLLGTAPTAGTYKESTQNVTIVAQPTQTYGGKTASVSTTGTNSTSAYTTTQGVLGPLTFSNIVQAPAYSGIIQSAKLSLNFASTVGFKLYVFNANPTNSTFTDHTTLAIGAADIASLIDVITFASADSGLGTHTLYAVDGIGKAFNTASITSLYGVLVPQSAITFPTTNAVVSVTLNVLQD